MVSIFWIHGPISLNYVVFGCQFLDPHLTTYHSNIGVLVLAMLDLGHVYLEAFCLPICSNLPLKYTLWIGAVSARLVGRWVLYSYRFLDPLIRWIAMGDRWNLRQHAWPKSSLSRHLLNLKVPPTSKALKLYTALPSISTTNCFARVFKW